ncbi:DUF4492 domain-containing protein [Daejeonia sp. YH14]|uniref:DUF4492 domain-containing protein n=1 Tax=Daejeonia sp. YH14 TaxID=3439042 RepID=UPI003F497609
MIYRRFCLLFYPFAALIGLYKHGFSIMSKESKMLWAIALIKLFVMFGILKIFFFKDFLKTNFDTDQQRIEYLQQKFTETEK